MQKSYKTCKSIKINILYRHISNLIEKLFGLFADWLRRQLLRMIVASLEEFNV